MSILKKISLIILMLLSLNACKHIDDSFLYISTRPLVSGRYFVTDQGASLKITAFDDKVEDTLAYSLLVKGEIAYYDTSITILDYGHVWSTNPDPKILSIEKIGDSALSAKGKDLTNFVDTITNLKMLTPYYIRSFVITKSNNGTKVGYNPVQIKIATISAKNEWIPRTALPANSRQGAIAVTLDNKGYVIGGHIGLSYVNDTWLYNPNEGSWTQRASIPGKRGYGVGFALKGKVYAGLGQNSLENLDDFYVYDPATANWTEVNTSTDPFPGGKRTKAVAFAIGNFGYIGTGDVGAVVADFYKFDPSAFENNRNPWKPAAPIGKARKAAVANVVGDFAYVATGEDENGNVLKDMWIFSADANSWGTQASLPDEAAARKGAFSFSIWKTYSEYNFQEHGEFYVGGGIAQDSSILSDVWMFIPEEQSWSIRKDYPVGPISFASGFSLEYQREQESFSTMKGFVVGGHNGTKFVNYLYEFLP